MANSDPADSVRGLLHPMAREPAPISRVEAKRLLDPVLPANAVDTVLAAARKRRRFLPKDRGRVWGAIGVCARPCPKNCGFCSLGQRWKVYPEPFELSFDEVCRQAAALAAGGASWITLRTTQDYSIERLARLGETVRGCIADDIELVANTGELSPEDARMLHGAGFTTVYHVCRLREGTDTGIPLEDRLETLASIRGAGLQLAFLVEPLGPEHLDEEIVTEAFRAREWGAVVVGAMARVPVAGTPLYSLGTVSEERLARVVALTRLLAGPEVKGVCVHPPSVAGIEAGADTVVVETGAIPRDAGCPSGVWRDFAPDTARKLFRESGLIPDPDL